MTATTISGRKCQSCGALTTSPVLCGKCYRTSPAGRSEAWFTRVRKNYKPQEDGGACKHCIHWKRRCLLGFPEGGTLAAAELCSAREVDSLLE